MARFERAGSGEEVWVEPSRRRPRKGPPRQDKGGRNAALLALNRVHGIPVSKLSAMFKIPASTVRSALESAREKGRRRAPRPTDDDDEG